MPKAAERRQGPIESQADANQTKEPDPDAIIQDEAKRSVKLAGHGAYRDKWKCSRGRIGSSID